MTANGHVNTRIHAIVLTQDRPEVLRRCVATALFSLGSQDMLTVIDDSCQSVSLANRAVLTMTPMSCGPARVHLTTARAREIISRSVSASMSRWYVKTARRDIAPLRNLTLLLSVAAPADVTVLIDDDIHKFDLVATHRKTNALDEAGSGVIAGAEISGVNEKDTVTRLSDAIDLACKLPPAPGAESARALFQMPSPDPADVASKPKYVSAGYLGFRVPRRRLVAFPPGYNEDWLWCLVQSGNGQVRIARLGDSVQHDPPAVRRSTHEDLLFELVGELVFECVEKRCAEGNLLPEAALAGLLESFPGPEAMPLRRAVGVIERARLLADDSCSSRLIEQHGLTALKDMAEAGELDIDVRRLLRDWSCEAIAKQRSVEAMLHDDSAIATLRLLLREERL